ncbi:MAG TPA: FAD:protein FMN transferase [Candidatus Gallacutalibacter stercoravium]|nr:FAD:protein FMN transferase [Candidatus Gallacutalibacter stercoravium]
MRAVIYFCAVLHCWLSWLAVAASGIHLGYYRPNCQGTETIMKQQTKQTGIPRRTCILLALGLAVLAAILVWAIGGVGQQETPYTSTSVAMGTYVQQTIYGDQGEEAAAQAVQAISGLEDKISWRIEDSDVARLNEAAGSDWIQVDEETVSLLSLCLDVAEKSNGAFDPTILPLSALWDFGGDNQQLPSEEQIEEFRSYVNWQNLRIDTENQEASLKNRLNALDLGAAGKGAACDAAIDAYKQAGVNSAVVSVGGSVGLLGMPSGKNSWAVAVRDPLTALEDGQSTSLGTLSLQEGYLSTSGIYERYFEQDGVFYHHILDPKTGYPVENDLASVTVVCQNGALSDILSTACFVLGREEGAALLAEYGASGLFVTKDRHVYITPGLAESFTLEAQDYTVVTLEE